MKIATKVVTLARGKRLDDILLPSGQVLGGYETFIRVVKSRMDGSITWYCAKLMFDPKINDYRGTSVLGELSKDRSEFIPIPKERYPRWYRRKNGLGRGVREGDSGEGFSVDSALVQIKQEKPSDEERVWDI